jgi:uncharacterized protein (TIGR02001 family)
MHPAQRLLPFAASLLAAAATAISPGAHAADATDATDATLSPAPFTASATLASQYVSRGIRQSWGRPALQGSIDYAHPGGWSAGAFASTVDGRLVENGSVELDLYGGYSGTAGPLGFSAIATWYKYPGARIAATGTRLDYAELSAGLSWGAFYAKYNYTVTPGFFGIEHARGTGYLDAGINQELPHGLTLSLHAGDGRVAGAGNGIWDWRDLRAGVSRKLEGGWAVALNYTRAFGATGAYERYTTGVPRGDGRPAVSNVARGTVVLSLTRTF